MLDLKVKKGKCTAISPIVYVCDLDRAIDFYVRVLGFHVGASMEGYAYIVREGVAIRLITSSGDSSRSEQSCYICVENIDELYAELKPQLDLLAEGRVKPPFDQPYGQREFHVIDEDDLLIFFGEPA